MGFLSHHYYVLSLFKPVGYLQVWTRIWTRRNREQIQLSVREEGGSWTRCLRIASHSVTLTPIKKVVSEWFPLLIFPSYFLYFLCKKYIFTPYKDPKRYPGCQRLFMRGFRCFGRRKITGPGYPSNNKISNLHYTNSFWRFLNTPSSFFEFATSCQKIAAWYMGSDGIVFL